MRVAGSRWVWLGSTALVVLGAWWLHTTATAGVSAPPPTEDISEISPEAVTTYIHRSVETRQRQRYEERHEVDRVKAHKKIDDRLPRVMRALHIDVESKQEFRAAVVVFTNTMGDIMLDVRTGRADLEERYRREDTARVAFRQQLGMFLDAAHADTVFEAISW